MEEIHEIPCPGCGEPVLEAAEFCPACFASTTAQPATAVEEDVDVEGSEAERSAPAPRETPPELVPDPEAPLCPDHPARPIATTCERCGRFLCIDCEPKLLRKDKVTCRRCRERVRLDGAPKKLRQAALQLAATYLGIGAFIFLFILVYGYPAGQGTISNVELEKIYAVLVATVLALPFLILGLIVGFFRSVIAAWMGFCLQGCITIFISILAFPDGALWMMLLSLAATAFVFVRSLELTLAKAEKA